MKISGRKGQVIAETAASMVLLLALGILVLFVVCSMSYAYLVRAGLAEASRYAARNMAVAYGADPSIAQSRAMQEMLVFDKVRIHNIVVSSDQFTDPVFNTAAGERSVRVSVRYAGGQYGLPPFPMPDPLSLRFQTMEAISVYRLE